MKQADPIPYLIKAMEELEISISMNPNKNKKECLRVLGEVLISLSIEKDE